MNDLKNKSEQEALFKEKLEDMGAFNPEEMKQMTEEAMKELKSDPLDLLIESEKLLMQELNIKITPDEMKVIKQNADDMVERIIKENNIPVRRK